MIHKRNTGDKMKKVPLTARIDPALALKLEAMQKNSDMDKTACLESALNFFFENCPDISEARPPADQDLVKALVDALQSPEVIRVIQACITPNDNVIQACDTAGRRENKQSVIQPCDTVIHSSNTQENNEIQVKPDFKRHKKQDQAGPTEQEINKALSRSLEELFTLEELARIKDLTPEEQEDLRKSKARVSWVLEVKEKEGSKNFDKSSKNAGTCGREYRRGRDMLKEFGF